MNKTKTVVVSLFFIAFSITLAFAGFKFGLINAVKDAAEKLDKKFMDRGGPVPEAPSSVSATPASSTRIDVTWQDNSSTETGFNVEYSQNSNSDFSEGATVTVHQAPR